MLNLRKLVALLQSGEQGALGDQWDGVTVTG
jgi:hypothetical protein